MKTQSLKTNKYLWLSITLIIGFLILSFRLTASGLWYDECVEYYFSKKLTGTTPGFPQYHSMYERITATGQPPLFNVLMFIWVNISSSEIWLRLAGVFTTLLGGAGLFFYCSKKNNFLFATALTITYLSAFPIRYFALEIAEYNLMCTNLLLMLLSFLAYVEYRKRPFLFVFFVFAILSAYSQYGSVFVVAAFTVLLFFFIVFSQKKDFIPFIVTGVATLIFAVYPLIRFFLIPQMEHQGSKDTDHTFEIRNSIVKDFLSAIQETFKYLFLRDQPYIGKLFLFLLTIGILCLIIIYIFKTRSTHFLLYFLGCILSFLLYYLFVKTKYYGMVFVGGNFGNHWALMLAVVFLLLVMLTLLETFHFYPKTVSIILCMFLLMHGYSLFTVNWTKENMRELVNQVISWNTANNPIVLTYTEIIPFYYYTLNSEIHTSSLDLWTYHCENISDESIKNNLVKDFDGKIPSSFILIAGTEDTPESILNVLSSMGYHYETIAAPETVKNNLADMPMKSFAYQVSLY